MVNANVTLEDVSQVKTGDGHYKLCDAGGQEWASFTPSREKAGREAEIVAPPAIRCFIPKDEEIQLELKLIKEYETEPIEDSPAYIRGAVE
jgi:hypothetical protein